MNTRRWIAAAAALTLCLAAGCATRVAVSKNQDRLWNASLHAMEEQPFQTLQADRDKGQITGIIVTPAGERTEPERLRVRVTLIDAGQGQWEARVYARRSLAEDKLPVIDESLRPKRKRVAATGRSLGDYGTVATRDTRLEKTIIERIRQLLAGAAPLTPAPVAP